MQITTAWVKPPVQSNGQDHLGMQQPPMRILGSLLPGLTVSTTRVIYLSFHPWVLHHHPSTGLDLETALRRSECLLTLIAERHARTSHRVARDSVLVFRPAW